jgi:hypothetical protein
MAYSAIVAHCVCANIHGITDVPLRCAPRVPAGRHSLATAIAFLLVEAAA